MIATAFPYYTPAFSEYNVAQSAAVPFLDNDVNLVVSFATAVGKTVLAECCFAYHLKTDDVCRVAYVCPFRSLGSEKYEDWKASSQLSPFGLVLVTGDTVPSAEEYEKARIVVMTSESFDSKTRSGSWNDWLRSLNCIVFDEAHLIANPHRGGSVESAIMRVARINPKARIVLLSATMSNAVDLAKWVKALNGKETKCVCSSWRPNRVETDYVVVDKSEDKMDEAVRLAAESSDRKTVVFVHSKIVGAQIVKRLREKKVRSVFHNASVSLSQRRKIEEKFNDRMSGLNVLVSTSTLGAGVNIG